MRKAMDLKNQRFGRAIVLKRVENKGRYVRWLCKCDCGNEFVALTQHLRNGSVKSCGCLLKEIAGQKFIKLNTKHGKHKTRLYKIWAAIKGRCFNKNNLAYKNYGGRGITICDEWINNYPAFEIWANENGYNDTLTIDRIDVNGNYEPSNCRWATRQEQQNNRRACRYITYNGKTKTIAEWARILNIPANRIWHRLDRGWSIKQALSTKKREARLIEYQGKKRTIKEWATVLKISVDTIRARIRMGWPIELVLSQKNYLGKKVTKDG